MKKILLQINSVINFGSTGRIAEEIGQTAIDNGWESYIAYARNEALSHSRKIKIGGKIDIYWHLLMTRLFDRHGLFSSKATKKLIEEIKKIKPDIIHLHNIHGYYINYPILFKFLAGYNAPIIWTLHDCWSFTGHCPHFMFINCEKWKQQCNNCPNKKDYPQSLWIDRSKKNFRDKKEKFTSVNNMTMIPVSRWLGNELRSSFLSKYPQKIIHNGIDIETFSEQKNNIKKDYKIENRFLILGVASIWSERKGLRDFLKLSENLQNDEVIILVGLTKKQIAKLPSNIIGIERTENINQLAELYSSADVFFNPTWEDNFPTTNLEALACGTPIITYKTGGSVEAVTEDVGFIVNQGDLSAVIDIISQIKGKGKSFYSGNCRKSAVKYFNKNDRYQDYINLYNELIQQK